MRREILVVMIISLIAAAACERVMAPSYGINGRLVAQQKGISYLIDLGSIYKPDPSTAIVIVAIVEKNGSQLEWVVEADLNKGNFARAVGPYYFVRWPIGAMVKAIEMIKATPYEAPSEDLELLHPLGAFTPAERIDYIYSQVGDPDFRRSILTGVKSWAMKRAVEVRSPGP